MAVSSVSAAKAVALVFGTMWAIAHPVKAALLALGGAFVLLNTDVDESNTVLYGIKSFLVDIKKWIDENAGVIKAAIAALGIALAALNWPLALIVALVAIVAANWEGLKVIIGNVATAISDFFTTKIPNWWENSIIKPIKDAWQGIIDMINNAIDAVKEFFGIGDGADKRREEYVAGIEEQKLVAEANAGKYAHWTDAQKDAAMDYLYGADIQDNAWMADAVAAMQAAGLDQESIDQYRTDVSDALAEGDYYITIEDTWFAEGTEANLQAELDKMGLSVPVDFSLNYSGMPSVNIPGAATGLDRVPYDNYLVRLHKDEAVLNATNAAVWRNGGGMGNTSRLEGMMAQLLGVMNQVVANTGRGQNIVLDSGVLVGQIAGQMDIQLGTMASKKGRGIG